MLTPDALFKDPVRWGVNVTPMRMWILQVTI